MFVLLRAMLLALITMVASSASAGTFYAAFNDLPYAPSNGVGIYPMDPGMGGTGGVLSSNPQDLTIAGDHLYWIDGNTVRTANLDGSNASTYRTFGVSPSSIAVDPIGGHFYAAFNNLPYAPSNGVGIYPMDPGMGGTGGVLSSNPQDLTIAGGHLYWIDGDTVRTANLDGSNALTYRTFGVSPSSIAVDPTGGRFYAAFNDLPYAPSNGVGIYPMDPGMGGTGGILSSNPQDLTIAGDHLYWIDGDTVRTANLDGSSPSVYRTFGVSPSSIAVYDPPPVPVPEPLSAGLLLTGVLALGVLRTKRS